MFKNEALRYPSAEPVLAEVLDEVYVPVISNQDVYGTGLKEIAAITGSPDSLFKFPYDWRQSNVKSAADFSQWLCRPAIAQKIKDRPVIFIAHSMGGLILKYWLMHHYKKSGCDANDRFVNHMPIFKIAFVGTPNFGSPKAILAFSQKESSVF